MVPLNSYRLGSRHLKRAVIVFGFVGRKEIRRRRVAVVMIHASAPPAEVRFALKFVRIRRFLPNLHVHRVTDAKNFPISRFVMGAIPVIAEPGDDTSQPAVVAVLPTQPRSFPAAREVVAWRRGSRLFPVAVEGGTTGRRGGQQHDP